MKIQAFTLLATATAATASAVSKQLPTEISANSDLGRSILSQSRRLDENGQEQEEENAYTWIAGYSLKFQGCRYHSGFNSEADEDGDVKVSTSKLAHFRLCPASSCDGWRGGGCTTNYGDYVVDLATFAKTFVEGQKRAAEYTCQMYMYENCDCTESDDKDDGFDKDYCEYDCYNDSKKMQGCIERNPYNDDENSEDYRGFEAQEYAECKEWEMPEDDDGGRRLEEAEEEEEVQYFIGPYCSADGGSVYLGLYTDDTCTNFADTKNGQTTYKELSGGEDLPFATSSLITSDCVTCIEQDDPNRDEDDDDDSIEISDQCENLYTSAGKCESGINVAKSGMTSTPNTAACSYISGIQFTKVNGVIEMKSSKTASFFIFMFAASFIGLAGVVFKLHKDIKDAKRSPLLEREDSQEDQDLK